MKNFIFASTILFTALTTQAGVLKTASLNLEGWADSSNSRAVKLQQIFQSQGIMKDLLE